MLKWSDFWALTVPVFAFGFALGCAAFRFLLSYGWTN